MSNRNYVENNSIKKYHYYRRGIPGALPDDPGSPEFMRALIAKERQIAAQHAATRPTEAPSKRPLALATNQAQRSRKSSPAIPLVTRTSGDKRAVSPPAEVQKIHRRSAVTQADIARIIRAAKQAGAAEVQLRLNDSSTVAVRLEQNNSVARDEEIIL